MAKKITVFLSSWVPVIVWMGVISYFSSLPGEALPDIGISGADKLFHFGEFCVLGYLLTRAFRIKSPSFSLTKIVILSIIIASFYAGVDEWHQRFISERAPDLVDFLADLFGACFGIALYMKKTEKVDF